MSTYTLPTNDLWKLSPILVFLLYHGLRLNACAPVCSVGSPEAAVVSFVCAIILKDLQCADHALYSRKYAQQAVRTAGELREEVRLIDLS
jgi:hypothetical protein